MIVDERLAKRFWPKSDPVGRRMYLPQSPEDVVKPGPKVEVAPGRRRRRERQAQGPRSKARTRAWVRTTSPTRRIPARGIGLAIRSASDDVTGTKAAVERALAEIDPEVQLFDSFAMRERVDRSLDSRRAPMLLLVMFGGVALLLASLGIYGVLAYQVGQRTREIGIRIALGSDARGILRLVLREADQAGPRRPGRGDGRRDCAPRRDRVAALRRRRVRRASDRRGHGRSRCRRALRLRRAGAARRARGPGGRAAAVAERSAQCLGLFGQEIRSSGATLGFEMISPDLLVSCFCS